MLIGKYLFLKRQKGATRIDQVDAREAVFTSDLLGANVLFDRQRIVSAALDGCVIGDDRTSPSGHDADPCHDASGRNRVVIDTVTTQLAKFKKRCAGIEQRCDPLTGWKLAA